jgi:hypothetical protein
MGLEPTTAWTTNAETRYLWGEGPEFIGCFVVLGPPGFCSICSPLCSPNMCSPLDSEATAATMVIQ